MQHYDYKQSCIIISSVLEDELQLLRDNLNSYRMVEFIEDEFKIENAKSVIAEAYVSEADIKYIILCSKTFNVLSQNTLLKVFEEPPRNIIFIILTSSKSSLLPTIKSRLPIVKSTYIQKKIELDLNLSKIDYVAIFKFLKENSKVKKDEAKLLVEALYFRATEIDKIVLTSFELESFERAYRLLELNSRPQSVLAQLIMCFVKDKR